MWAFHLCRVDDSWSKSTDFCFLHMHTRLSARELLSTHGKVSSVIKLLNLISPFLSNESSKQLLSSFFHTNLSLLRNTDSTVFAKKNNYRAARKNRKKSALQFNTQEPDAAGPREKINETKRTEFEEIIFILYI